MPKTALSQNAELLDHLKAFYAFSQSLDEATFNGITGTRPLEGNINTRYVIFRQNPLKFLATFKKTEISLKLMDACLRIPH
jgi:hypothetical protein